MPAGERRQKRINYCMRGWFSMVDLEKVVRIVYDGGYQLWHNNCVEIIYSADDVARRTYDLQQKDNEVITSLDMGHLHDFAMAYSKLYGNKEGCPCD